MSLCGYCNGFYLFTSSMLSIGQQGLKFSPATAAVAYHWLEGIANCLSLADYIPKIMFIQIYVFKHILRWKKTS
jgi:hypothetical protein